MNRRIPRTLAVVALGLLCQAALLADDRVEYRDAKNRAAIVVGNGTITEENFAIVKLKSAAGGKETTIPVNDIVKIVYELPGAAKLDYGPIAGLEERQELSKALEGYKNLLGKVGGGTDKAKRFVEYKVAVVSAALADETPAALPAAIEALKKFTLGNTTTWHASNAAKMLIDLSLRVADDKGALAAADAWSKLPNLPKEVKQDAEAARVEILFQTNKLAEAKAKAGELAKSLPAADPMKAKLEMYTIGAAASDAAAKPAEVAKKLEDAIAKANDPSVKAAGYLVLGDVYALKGQPRDAMWSYLWVDVVYNQDRNDHARAIGRLIKLFDSDAMKDAERVKMYRDKLARVRQ